MNTHEMQLAQILDEAEALSQLHVAAALALSLVDAIEHAGRSSIPAPLARHG